MRDINSFSLAPCPHCGSGARIVDIHNGHAVVCNNKSCLGQMHITFGSCDNKELFLHKLVSDWNKRGPEIKAVTEAISSINDYKDSVYEDAQEAYDVHGSCCIDVLDEVINILTCYTAFDYTKERNG